MSKNTQLYTCILIFKGNLGYVIVSWYCYENDPNRHVAHLIRLDEHFGQIGCDGINRDEVGRLA